MWCINHILFQNYSEQFRIIPNGLEALLSDKARSIQIIHLSFHIRSKDTNNIVALIHNSNYAKMYQLLIPRWQDSLPGLLIQNY